MNTSNIFILFLIFPIIFSVNLKEALSNLKILESYISQYKTEKSATQSLQHLILAFIRLGKYSDSTWTIVAGSVPKDLYDYVKAKDAQHNTKALNCRSYGDIILPTDKKIDFVHLFAVMNGMDYSPSDAALVGWGGDLAQLAQDIKNNFKNINDLDKLIVEAKKYLGVKGQFGEGDLNADIDAPIILKMKKSSITFADTIQRFYDSGDYKNKVKDFAKIIFPDLPEKSKIRQYITNKYTAEGLIQILECKYGIRKPGSILGCYSPHEILPQFANHRKAAIYAFADYISDNI